MRSKLPPAFFVVVVAAVASASTTALACPVCDTGTGEQVRAGILDGNFGRTLLGVVLPFPILLGVVALIHFGLPWQRPTGTGGSRSIQDQRTEHGD